MTFEIKQKCRLNTLTPKPEKDPDQRTTVYLGVMTDCGNSILVGFHPALRDMLFKETDDPDLVDEVEDSNPMQPRFPNMAPTQWKQELLACTVTIDYGLGGDSNIVLEDCKVDKFKFAPKHGGTVTVFYRIVSHPDERSNGLLVGLVVRDIEVEIKLPPPQTAADMFPKAA